MQNPDDTSESISRKTSENNEVLNNDQKTTLNKKTSQLSQLPPHKIRSKKLSKSSATSCTGGGIVIAHEKENLAQHPTDHPASTSTKMASHNLMEMKLPDKIDLPKLALDQLSNCSSNNSPRNFILSPRSQKSLFTAAQSPLATGKCSVVYTSNILSRHYTSKLTACKNKYRMV